MAWTVFTIGMILACDMVYWVFCVLAGECLFLADRVVMCLMLSSFSEMLYDL